MDSLIEISAGKVSNQLMKLLGNQKMSNYCTGWFCAKQVDLPAEADLNLSVYFQIWTLLKRPRVDTNETS